VKNFNSETWNRQKNRRRRGGWLVVVGTGSFDVSHKGGFGAQSEATEQKGSGSWLFFYE